MGAPLVSFVVPAYRVQGYLRECLDSILTQPVGDVEVIAVDDASPDSTGEILAEYAARDPRVRVLTLPENVGLGEARNRGLDQATGTYVWFLDSDDWLVPGCLAMVARRLRDTDPDVLVVDHVRVHVSGGGGRSGSAMAAAFPSPVPADVFTARDRPAVFDLLHTAWNKVIRRRFLVDLNLRFAPGWYEDVSFSYPVLMAAERIAVLDRVCVNYRQRRTGAITRTRGDRHFEVFPQWHRVFALMDEWGDPVAELRPQIFQRMVSHYLSVFGSGARLAPERRPLFFAQVVEDYRRWLPAQGFQPPGGIEGLKYRLVAGDHFGAYAALRGAYRARGKLAGGGAALRGVLAPRVRRSARLGRDAVLRSWYRVQLRAPIDPSLALYAAYWYRGYACNPASIYETAKKLAPGIRGVWVVRRDRVASLPPGVEYVVAGTPGYFRALARARYLINNVNFPDYVVKRPGSVHLQTHHGTPVKVMGLDQQRYPLAAGGLDFAKLLRRVDRWDWSVTANSFSTQMWERAYPADYATLETGYPRNDRLATASAAGVAAARARIGAGAGDRVVLYAPTHREHLPDYRPPFDPDEFLAVLGPTGRLLIRGHYLYDRVPGGPAGAVTDASESDASGRGATGRVLDVSDHPSVEELYLAADVLVTDYSSAMFDYAVLDRPIVVYAPDWEEYRLARGVYLDVVAEPPGAVARTFVELLDVFRGGVVDAAAATGARHRFRDRFCAFEDGHAAERVVRRVLLGEPAVNRDRTSATGD